VSDPNAPPQQQYTLPPSHDGGSGLKIPILIGAVIALIAANIYLFLQIDGLKHLIAKNDEALQTEISTLRETGTASARAARQNIDTLKDELETARRQASMAVGQAKVDATKHAEEIARKLEGQQKASEQAVRTEISQVQQQTNTEIGQVNEKVAGVKTEVASARSDIDKTIADLRSARGDLGVQSGLIATNSKELAALKALGERNYFEFNLSKSKEPSKVGDIQLQLNKADQKKNRFTLTVLADDKKVEKKDRGLNEPIQFYTSKAKQPYEIVVNEVKKDNIIGYLSTPKVQSGRND
jgi:hypothetical protein